MGSRWKVLIGMCVALAWPITAQATQYTFTKIAETGGLFTSFGSASLNDQGDVAFHAATTQGEGIYTGNGGTPTPVLTSGGQYKSFQGPDTNNNGVIAFKGRLTAGGWGVYKASSGVVSTVVDTTSGFQGFGSYPSINDSGTVAFSGVLTNGTQVLLTGNGGPLTTIADSSGLFFGFGGQRINNSGQVAFQAYHDSFPHQGIYRTSGSALVTIAEILTSTGDLGASPSLNDSGMVVFDGAFGGPRHVYSGNGGAISDLTTAYAAAANPLINDAGEVAFGASIDGVVGGLFMGPDPGLDHVIYSRDGLLGASIVRFALDRADLNNLGEIVFGAHMFDGRDVIVKATPVPEPASSLLVMLGILHLRGRRLC